MAWRRDPRALMGFVGLGVSGAIGMGALLVMREDRHRKEKEFARHFSSDGRTESVQGVLASVARVKSSGGASAIKPDDEAYTVGEKVSTEELHRRFQFHTKGEKNGDGTNNKRLTVIGRGAYGRVISAKETSTGKEVAIKVVPKHAMSAEGLLREVEVLRRVRGHDSIIQLLDVLECGGEWYVVTELCEGGELLDRLIRNGPYDEKLASSVIRRLASALEHIHTCGYVHLDMKPENVVFSKAIKSRKNVAPTDPSQPLDDDCRIIDFGMALEMAGIARHGGLIMSHGPRHNRVRVGTLAYWSPEQVRSLLSQKALTLLDSAKRQQGGDPFLDEDKDEDEEESTSTSQISSARLSSGLAAATNPTDLEIIPATEDHAFIQPQPSDSDPSSSKKGSGDLFEDLKGNKPSPPVKADPRASDVWALGVIMYIMLLGCHPFDQKGSGDEKFIARGIVSKEVDLDVHKDRINLSDNARDLLARMLDKNPATRLTTEDILRHPWIVPESSLPSLKHAKIPHSWTQAGYIPPHREKDKVLLSKDPERIRHFRSERCLRAFVRALLIAGMNNASQRNTAGEGERKGSRRFSLPTRRSIFSSNPLFLLSSSGDPASAEAIFSAAFDVLDTSHSGMISLDDVEDLFRALEEGGAGSTPSPSPSSSSSKSGPTISKEEFYALLRTQDLAVRTFKAGEAVFNQGAVPQGMYILAEGNARVEWDPIRAAGSTSSSSTSSSTSSSSTAPQNAQNASNPSQNNTMEGNSSTEEKKDNSVSDPPKKVVYEYATMKPGTIFGETALVQGRRARAATIRCVTPCVVIFVPKDEFLHALAGSKILNQKMFTIVAEQQARRVHELIEYLQPKSYREAHFKPGEVLFQQGDPATELFLIRKGVVEVSVRAPASRNSGASDIGVRVGQRGTGDILGVSAVVGGLRHTTAKALVPVDAIAISQADAQQIWRDVPIFQFYLQPQIQWRNEAWQEAVTDVERGVSEPQLLPILGGLGTGAQKDAYLTFQKAMATMKRRSYKLGDTIVQKERAGKEFFIVESGFLNVELSLSSPEPGSSSSSESTTGHQKDSMIVALLGPGDHIGEQSLLRESGEDVASVTAASDVEIFVMDKQKFTELIGNGETPFAQALSRAAKQREHRWARNLLTLAMRSSEEASLGERGGWTRVKPGVEERGGVFRITLAKGEELFAKGDDVDALYFIHRGELTLYDSDSTGDEITMAQQLETGDTIGWEVFGSSSNQTHLHTARASTDRTVVSKIPKRLLHTLIEQNRYVSPKLEKRVRKSVVVGSAPKIQKHRSLLFGEASVSEKLRHEGIQVGKSEQQ